MNEINAKLDEINAKLDRIEAANEERVYRRRMSYKDLAAYTGIPVKTLYSMTARKIGPKPHKQHKLAPYFIRKEVDAWLASNGRLSEAELNDMVDRGLA